MPTNADGGRSTNAEGVAIGGGGGGASAFPFGPHPSGATAATMTSVSFRMRRRRIVEEAPPLPSDDFRYGRVRAMKLSNALVSRVVNPRLSESPKTPVMTMEPVATS